MQKLDLLGSARCLPVCLSPSKTSGESGTRRAHFHDVRQLARLAAPFSLKIVSWAIWSSTPALPAIPLWNELVSVLLRWNWSTKLEEVGDRLRSGQYSGGYCPAGPFDGAVQRERERPQLINPSDTARRCWALRKCSLIYSSGKFPADRSLVILAKLLTRRIFCC